MTNYNAIALMNDNEIDSVGAGLTSTGLSAAAGGAAAIGVALLPVCPPAAAGALAVAATAEIVAGLWAITG